MNEQKKENRNLWIMMVLLLSVRFLITIALKTTYTINSDDLAYVNSGFNLLKNGIITCHNQYPSAQAMPGITLLFAAVAFVFGEGLWFWRVTKVLWALCGVASAYYTYKSVRIFTSPIYALLAMIPFFRPDIVWCNNLLLTETPFILCLAAIAYYTLNAGAQVRANNVSGGSTAFVNKNLIIWFAFFIIGVLLRATMFSMAVFSLVYLLICRYPVKMLLKKSALIIIATAIILAPWAIRNYKTFGEFNIDLWGRKSKASWYIPGYQISRGRRS